MAGPEVDPEFRVEALQSPRNFRFVTKKFQKALIKEYAFNQIGIKGLVEGGMFLI